MEPTVEDERSSLLGTLGVESFDIGIIVLYCIEVLLGDFLITRGHQLRRPTVAMPNKANRVAVLVGRWIAGNCNWNCRGLLAGLITLLHECFNPLTSLGEAVGVIAVSRGREWLLGSSKEGICE